MMITFCRRRAVAVLVSMPLLLASNALYGQDQFSARFGEAKRLYEAAEYDLALAQMDAIDFATVPPEQARDASLYEALCLMALDRTPEAVSKIEQIVRGQPLFHVPDDTPPRVRALVDDVRNRLRPALVQQHYQSGKALFDADAYARAIEEFTLVIELVDDAGEGIGASGLGDVKTLAVGFRDLSQRALASSAPNTVPATAMTRDAAPAPNGTAVPGGASAPDSAPVESTIVPPVVIRQNVPEWPRWLSINTRRQGTGTLDGVLDIIIGSDGKVESVELVTRIHPLYDGLLIEAAKRWQYQPATRNGQPMPYPKRIMVKVTTHE
jgi:hypothetical protein